MDGLGWTFTGTGMITSMVLVSTIRNFGKFGNFGNEQILTEPKMLTKKVKIDSYILKISTKSILDQ